LRPRGTWGTRPARSLVALGYWNDPAKTAERFKAAPGQPRELPLTEMAVWSGDTVKRDEDGFLYFIGRKDEMIKTSGYRVSPSEVEEVAYASGMVVDAVAVGVPHPSLGQAIVLVVRTLDRPPATRSRRRGRGSGRRHTEFSQGSTPEFHGPSPHRLAPGAPTQPERQVRPPGPRGAVQNHLRAE